MKENNLVELRIKLNDLIETEKYLKEVLNEEHIKYWNLRQNIKDKIKVINDHCIFETLENQMQIIDDWTQYLKETKILIRSTKNLINARRKSRKLKPKKNNVEVLISGGSIVESLKNSKEFQDTLQQMKKQIDERYQFFSDLYSEFIHTRLNNER